jgi:phosphoribosylanthranilate isomerase
VTEVKICGLTRPEDVDLACELGASYVGFNFAAVSKRRVTAAEGRRLSGVAAPGVARVGVFVGESYETIGAVCEEARLDLVQLHRGLVPQDLERVPRPVVAVARVGSGAQGEPPEELLAGCRALLFDTAVTGSPGGTGAVFDWSVLLGRRFPVPCFLAGGLTPENVGEALRRVRPAGVDVASGVEAAPGVKDPDRMAAFFEAVRRADAAR